MRLRIHIALVSATLVLVGFLVNEFVQANLGEDFIGYVEDADGTDHPYYHIGEIMTVFAVLSVPAVLFVVLIWEAIWFIISMFRR